MSTILKAADLTSPELTELIGALKPQHGELVRIWLEAADGWALTYWPGLAGSLPWCGAGRSPHDLPAVEAVSRSYAGRLFTRSGELRWRVLPMLGERQCRTVFLGTAEWAPDRLSERTELQGLHKQDQPQHVMLWGQQTGRTPGEWVELRIPHRFRYPVPAPESLRGRLSVKADVEVWFDDGGEMHFMRLCDLQASEEE